MPIDPSGEIVLDPPNPPRILDGPPARGRVLVLAPHADDETIGPGGTVLLHHEAGDEVDLLCLTTGITGNADGRYAPEEYVRVRREECREACKVLGIREAMFWDYPDNHVVTEQDMEALVGRFLDVLEKGRYEVVYTPHRGEMHSDHHASAVMAARAARRLGRPLSLWGYEIWAPIEAAHCVVDVTGVFPRKLQAAACYRSQTALRDIGRLFSCLNGYRSAFLEGRGEFAEAFLRMGGDA